jgi:hypothetical protein
MIGSFLMPELMSFPSPAALFHILVLLLYSVKLDQQYHSPSNMHSGSKLAVIGQLLLGTMDRLFTSY